MASEVITAEEHHGLITHRLKNTMGVKSVLVYWKTVVVVTTPILLLPLPLYEDSPEGRCAYSLLIMAVYWLTEALPIAVTAFLPLVLFPLLEIVPAREVSVNYFKDTNMMLFGSLIMAVSVERSNLHRRIALRMLLLMGTSPKWLLLSFMTSSWFLSMWITNTGTTAMMLAVATAVLDKLEESLSKEDGPACTPSCVGGESGHQMVNLPAAANSPANRYDGDTGSISKESTEQDSKGRIAAELRQHRAFSKLLVLCVPYSATIGGIGTLTGTPTNLVLKNVAEMQYGEHGMDSPITFAKWMVFATPLSALCLIVAWLWLVTYHLGFRHWFRKCCHEQKAITTHRRELMDVFRKEYASLGPFSFAEVCNVIFLAILVTLWLTRDPGFVDGWGSLFQKQFVSDSTPAILICILLFICPIKRPACGTSQGSLMDWPSLTNGVSWLVLLLIGGGFALADGCKKSGLSDMVAKQLVNLDSLPQWALVLLLSAAVAAITEVVGNVAVVNILLPIIGELATTIGMNPLYLMIPTTVAASFAFMLPLGTAPNAIVFSQGHLKVTDMVRVGFFLNVACVLIVTLVVETWGKVIFDLNNLPFGDDTSFPGNTTTASM